MVTSKIVFCAPGMWESKDELQDSLQSSLSGLSKSPLNQESATIRYMVTQPKHIGDQVGSVHIP